MLITWTEVNLSKTRRLTLVQEMNVKKEKYYDINQRSETNGVITAFVFRKEKDL